MSFTGRFEPDFNQATNLPDADLPRDEPGDVLPEEEDAEDE